jgi:arylformamidase
MKIIDISLTLEESMVVWPGDVAFQLNRDKQIAQKDSCNLSSISMGSHTGTHLDFPSHFLAEGASSDSLHLPDLIGPCYVAELSGQGPITRQELIAQNLGPATRVLLKTNNSDLWQSKPTAFYPDFRALCLDAARYLGELGVKLIGIDYLSIESFHAPKNEVHKFLLGQNILILEGLNLGRVNSGTYELICLPLKLAAVEGTPARAILRL